MDVIKALKRKIKVLKNTLTVKIFFFFDSQLIGQIQNKTKYMYCNIKAINKTHGVYLYNG